MNQRIVFATRRLQGKQVMSRHVNNSLTASIVVVIRLMNESLRSEWPLTDDGAMVIAHNRRPAPKTTNCLDKTLYWN